jgi:hypothetical protein
MAPLDASEDLDAAAALPDASEADAGACSPGTKRCGGSTCVQIMNDQDDCGDCGIVCPPCSTLCMGGKCESLDDCTDATHGLDPLVACTKGDSCTCRDVYADPENCSACGHACKPGDACRQGICINCAPGFTACYGICADLLSDPRNCGDCEHGCPWGFVCQAGVCACQGKASCTNGGTCDASGLCNCKGTACAPGWVCSAAAVCQPACPEGQSVCGVDCVDLKTDAANCGHCMFQCASWDKCVAGSCSY